MQPCQVTALRGLSLWTGSTLFQSRAKACPDRATPSYRRFDTLAKSPASIAALKSSELWSPGSLEVDSSIESWQTSARPPSLVCVLVAVAGVGWSPFPGGVHVVRACVVMHADRRVPT